MEPSVLVENLRQQLPSLLAVYAFGSYAQGTARPESDLDLVDLRTASTVLQHQVITTGQRLWCQKDLPVNLWEVFVLGEKLRLDEARGPLLKDIRETGVVHAR